MLYLMLIYHDDAKMAAASPDEQAAVGSEYGKLNAFLAQSGALRGTATWPAGVATMRSVDGRTQTSEGPFTEAANAVAGFFLIEAENIEAAATFAERVPAIRFGAVEIRPVQV